MVDNITVEVAVADGDDTVERSADKGAFLRQVIDVRLLVEDEVHHVVEVNQRAAAVGKKFLLAEHQLSLVYVRQYHVSDDFRCLGECLRPKDVLDQIGHVQEVARTGTSGDGEHDVDLDVVRNQFVFIVMHCRQIAYLVKCILDVRTRLAIVEGKSDTAVCAHHAATVLQIDDGRDVAVGEPAQVAAVTADLALGLCYHYVG